MGIPTIEPTAVTAGDTVSWQISLSDYPASAGWVLSYRLINAAGTIDITAAASGDDHLVVVAAAVTAAWIAGDYAWTRFVTRGAERHTCGVGRVTVRPDVATLSAYDDRSWERQALEALQAAYVDYLTNKQGHVAQYEIAGRHMTFRNAAEIWQQIDRLTAEVRKQEAAATLAAGLKPKRRILVRFN